MDLGNLSAILQQPPRNGKELGVTLILVRYCTQAQTEDKRIELAYTLYWILTE